MTPTEDEILKYLRLLTVFCIIAIFALYPMDDAQADEIGAPTGLTIQEQGDTVRISWDAPAVGSIQPERYAIMWTCPSCGNGYGIATGNGGDSQSLKTFIVIPKSMLPADNYTFQIRSDNDTLHAYSSYSNTATINTFNPIPKLDVLPSPVLIPIPEPSPTSSALPEAPKPQPTLPAEPSPSPSAPTPIPSPTPQPTSEPLPSPTPTLPPVVEPIPQPQPTQEPAPNIPEPTPEPPIPPASAIDPIPDSVPPEPPAIEPEPKPTPVEAELPPAEEPLPPAEEPLPEEPNQPPIDVPDIAPPQPQPLPEPVKEENSNLPPEPPIPGLIPNNPDSLPDDIPKLPEEQALKPHTQEDKPGVENGGIEFYGTKTQPQVIGEDGNLTPPPPAPGSGDPIPPDAITTTETFIGQPGGTTFNAPDIAVPVQPIEVNIDIPGVGQAAQAMADVYVAMANIGNDMSPITRKKAKKILVATLVVGQITQLRRRF
jgi:hypothetical protein